MGALSVEDAWFHAGGRDILQGISLEVAEGETVGLLGPSGSGKTTLLRMIAGLDRLSAGRVKFDGEDISGVPAHRRGFGMMFQDHGLFPHLDVAGNVGFGLRDMDATARRKRIAELLDLVGLAGFEKRRIDRLSGGERQRVALARALAPAPKLLMLDEPLASLDRSLRQRLVGELRDILAEVAIPAIYVTHDQFEAFALADRIVILDQGRVMRDGAPEAIWEEPRTEFVARFLGMDNIINGERDAEGMVLTPVGEFGPVPGAPGPLQLLLREEGARLADGPGRNVASGALRSTAFRGASALVGLERGAALEFEIAGGAPALEAGRDVHISVARVQELAAGGSTGGE